MSESVSEKNQFTKFLTRNSFELLLLGWVKSAKYNSLLSNEKAVEQFFKYFGITEDEFIKKESAARIIYRIEKEYEELRKNGEGK